MQSNCQIAMLLLPGFNAMAFHAFVDPFRAANYLKGEGLYSWPLLGFETGQISASNGLC